MNLKRSRNLAVRFDRQLGHFGHGPFGRLVEAPEAKQRRFVGAFNKKFGTVFTTIAEIIEWLATHQDHILAVVKLIMTIIGMFAGDAKKRI